MAAEIIKVLKEHLPTHRFIGIRYSDSDRDMYGSFGGKWGEWFSSDMFKPLEALGPLSESDNAFFGLMRCVNDNFEYWIGMQFPENTLVPEGYSYVDIEDGYIATCYIYGNEDNGELYGTNAHNACMDKVAGAGFLIKEDPWFFERYNCPRFTTPDENGKVILDYSIYIK